MQAQSRGISIRFAGPADMGEVDRLAQLDSAPPVLGETLVAEVDGHITAALPLARGRVIADPFVPSADLGSLLELRAVQIGRMARRRPFA
jgi:hypothetical protein